MIFLDDADGAEVIALSRRRPISLPEQVSWIEWSGKTVPDNIPEQLDAIVNLAGENIAGGRWTESRKQLLLQSRVDTTRLLVEGLKNLSTAPRLFLSASATGFYGNRDQDLLTEKDKQGAGFLASITRAWEQEALAAEQYGSHVTLLRIGVVLTPQGGAIKQMLLPFRLGLGGKMSTGKQLMSWITLKDLLAAIDFLLRHPLRGAVNLTAPRACQNELFARSLADALGRPACLPVPAWVLKLVFGQMAEELFLYSTRAYPARLLEAGFTFQHPEIMSACKSLFT